MKYGLMGLMYILCILLGAIAHEKDMQRNFIETGDAKGWFADIKCENDK